MSTSHAPYRGPDKHQLIEQIDHLVALLTKAQNKCEATGLPGLGELTQALATAKQLRQNVESSRNCVNWKRHAEEVLVVLEFVMKLSSLLSFIYIASAWSSHARWKNNTSIENIRGVVAA